MCKNDNKKNYQSMVLSLFDAASKGESEDMKNFKLIEMPFFQDVFGKTPLDYALSIDEDKSFYKSKLSIFVSSKEWKSGKETLENTQKPKLLINECIYNALYVKDTSTNQNKNTSSRSFSEKTEKTDSKKA